MGKNEGDYSVHGKHGVIKACETVCKAVQSAIRNSTVMSDTADRVASTVTASSRGVAGDEGTEELASRHIRRQ